MKGYTPLSTDKLFAEQIRRSSKAIAKDVEAFGEKMARLAEAAGIASAAVEHLRQTRNDKRVRELDD